MFVAEQLEMGDFRLQNSRDSEIDGEIIADGVGYCGSSNQMLADGKAKAKPAKTGVGPDL
ncbi:hypothetical protein DSO57_1022507 [Entomophthora muscae]|uniref:Uncharacterized protein n=1 Tax=Entomophthora muscae TaxID=34485 RepID=A0ACC2RHS6_9FUNG|nr:hypothetical protein DSO57_1022507 [Entomophthora muscae]